MRVPLSWLREQVAWEDTAESLAEALTARGVAVEEIVRPGAGVAGIVAATICATEPHPGRPGLRVCTVRAGTRRAQVVCGAPDAAAGALVPWALPGAVLPGGRRIEAKAVWGTASAGMLCAPDELGLPGGHAGLCQLGGQATGRHLAEGDDLVAALALDEEILILELTPNYAAHCQSILGVAREVAAITGGPLRPVSAAVSEDAETRAQDLADVGIAAAGACPRYIGRVLGGLVDRPAPLLLAQRLLHCGLRPLGGLVDITNYVMLELGQPLHAFDLDRLAGGRVEVRFAGAAEGITTLDGRARTLEEGDLVIADAAGPVAIAGVMGGERTEISPATVRVLLESAAFAPEPIASTGRRLGLISEAQGRFARGTDPELCRLAADRACALAQGHLGATVAAGVLEAGSGARRRFAGLRARHAQGLLGIRLPLADCGRHLERLGFSCQPDGADRLRVAIPSWRPDVAEEVDLIEEIGRAYGFDRIPATLPAGQPSPAAPDPLGPATAQARAVALAAGLSEVTPYSFCGTDLFAQLRLPPGHALRQAAAIANPMKDDQSLLRTTLAGGLLRTLATNAHQRRPAAACFEAGRVFRPRASGGRPDEPLLFGLAAYGPLQPLSWSRTAGDADFFAAKGLCEEIVDRCGGDAAALRWAVPEVPLAFLHPGRSAEIRAGAACLGWLGELHPEVALTFDLPVPGVLAEISLAVLASLADPVPQARPLPRHPAALRDIAVLAPLGLPAAELEAALRRAGGPLLAEARLFDVYTGPELPPGQRSLAWTLCYQADRTLTDADVNAAQDAIRQALAAIPDVTPRS